MKKNFVFLESLKATDLLFIKKSTHKPFQQYLSIIIIFYFNNFNVKLYPYFQNILRRVYNSYFQNILKRVNGLLFIRKKTINPSKNMYH